MAAEPLITSDFVDLDLKASDRGEASRSLAERLQAGGRVTDLDGFLEDISKREAQIPTGPPPPDNWPRHSSAAGG